MSSAISSVMVAFNLNLNPLFDAIAEIESDCGRLSKNVYQLQDIYIDDVNRILGRKEFKYEDKFDVGKSREMMVVYLGRYGAIYESKTGNAVTYSVLARIHNGGPDGWNKYATKRYAKTVMNIIESYAEKEEEVSGITSTPIQNNLVGMRKEKIDETTKA